MINIDMLNTTSHNITYSLLYFRQEWFEIKVILFVQGEFVNEKLS